MVLRSQSQDMHGGEHSGFKASLGFGLSDLGFKV